MGLSYKEARERRAQIFADTKRLYETTLSLSDAVKASINGQRFIDGEKPLAAEDKLPAARMGCKTKIVVSGKRSLEAAAAYTGKRVCVLNFASATNPGGGVVKGSNAQEEAICRCSTLYPCLDTPQMWAAFYTKHRKMLRDGEMSALYNDDCIYTTDVVVFKSDTAVPTLLPEATWYKVDVLTCAAPNLRENPSNAMNPCAGIDAVMPSDEELRTLHIRRAARILEIAAQQGVQVLILGAFGCGAFQNPPQVVAEAYKEALAQYMNAFETIEFAVYCPPHRTENYEVFKRVLAV